MRTQTGLAVHSHVLGAAFAFPAAVQEVLPLPEQHFGGSRVHDH